MIQLVNLTGFREELAQVMTIFEPAARPPAQVFRARPYRVYFADFDDVWSRQWFAGLQELTRRVHADYFTLGVWRPDPEDYYFSHFGKFPFLRFDLADSYEGYIAALNSNPGDSPADAIAYNSEVLIAYAPNLRWAIYCDRDFELSILGGMDEGAAAALESAVDLRLFSATDALDRILNSVYRESIPQTVRDQLLTNYAPSS